MERWWQEGFSSDNYNCTAENLEKVALYNIAPSLKEFPDDPDAVAEPNIVSLSPVSKNDDKNLFFSDTISIQLRL